MQMLVGEKFLRPKVSPLSVAVRACATFAILYGLFNLIAGYHVKSVVGIDSAMISRQLTWGWMWAGGGLMLLCVNVIANDPSMRAQFKMTHGTRLALITVLSALAVCIGAILKQVLFP